LFQTTSKSSLQNYTRLIIELDRNSFRKTKNKIAIEFKIP